MRVLSGLGVNTRRRVIEGAVLGCRVPMFVLVRGGWMPVY
jgi:hypothetical protein